jgi:hypothetical protein
MKVGDMIMRKHDPTCAYKTSAKDQHELHGYGIILKKQTSGRPFHPCISVLYPKTGKVYSIAESLVEVVSGLA